ncbi:MAG TPA: c-type cytochrome [Planctomycetota bacterium]|nr:c-type cytochrome [Planctomycetota bacterium]
MKPTYVAAVAGFAGLLVLSLTRPDAGPPRLPPASSRPRWSAVPVEPPPAPPAELLPQGERLYRWYCIPCHGPEGRGDGPTGERLVVRPRDLTQGIYKLKTSAPGEMPFDEDLYRTITAGIPPSGMPPFTDFDARDRWSLVAYVKSLARDSSGASLFERFPARTKGIAETPRASGNPQRGHRLYEGLAGCASCHGEKGRGDGPAAPFLRDSAGRPVRVPDFALGFALFLGGSAPEDVFRVLTLGFEGSPMPSFAGLSEQDRWDLAHFVTSLYVPLEEDERAFLRRYAEGR